MVGEADILSAVRRSDRAMVEQVSTWEALDFGVAHCSARFADRPESNQLREVWLADTSPASAFDRTDAYFAERGLTCRQWTPASGQDPAPIASFLAARGWQRIEHTAFGLVDGRLGESEWPPTLRILPARAMPRAYRETFAEASASLADIAAERLNEANLDAFVAVRGASAVGRISYLQAGDIARVADLFVLPEARRCGVGRAMIGHLLRLARRLLPKALVTTAHAEDDAAGAFLLRCGFAAAGRTVEFRRGDS